MAQTAKKRSTPAKKAPAKKTSATKKPTAAKAVNAVPASVTEAEFKKIIQTKDVCTTKKPTNVRELMALAYGEDLASMGENASFGNFNYDVQDDYKDRPEIINANVNAEAYKGMEFINGNYRIDDPVILAGAEAYGKEILLAAATFGVNITDLAEFKEIDYNGDGHIDAREVGFTILAASMDSRKADISTSDVSRQAGSTDVISTFTNEVNGNDLVSLLDAKRARVTKEIARQLMIDNGLMPDNNDNSDAANIEFVKAVKDDLAPPYPDGSNAKS